MSRDLVARFTSAHWGRAPRRQWEVKDPAYPDDLVEMGHLRRIQIKSGRDLIDVIFPTRGEHVAHLVWDDGPSQRLYIVGEKAHEPFHVTLEGRRIYRTTSNTLYIPEYGGVMSLRDAAASMDGRQAHYPFQDPAIPVQLVGEIHHVVYWTGKGEDDDPDGGVAEYDHEAGEDSGIRPYLAVDEMGRFWIVGGNYTVPDDGITD